MPSGKNLILALIFLLTFLTGTGQQKLLPLNNVRYNEISRNVARFDQYRSMSFRPMVEKQGMDSAVYYTCLDSSKVYYDVYMKLFKESLFIIDGEDYRFTIDPLLNFQFGDEFQDTMTYPGSGKQRNFYKNYRGIRIQGDIGDNFSFGTWFYEQQATLPTYYDSITMSRGIASEQLGVVPGMGRAKRFKQFGRDFGYAGGYLSIRLPKNFSIQAGHGKHIVGNGYRSMLLSDLAFNYPYLRVNWSSASGKLKYHTVYASLMNLARLPEKTTPEATFEKKAGSFHYLTYRPMERLEVSLFEGTIWERWDQDLGGTLPMNYMIFNPVIGLNSAVYGLEGRHNNLLGLNLAIYEPIKNVDVYGQLAIDDNGFEQMGWQVGGRVYDPFGIDDLIVQVEYNSATPRTYDHIDSKESYSHYNYSLAHPMGNGFDELFTKIRYKRKRFFAQAQLNVMSFDRGSDSLAVGPSTGKIIYQNYEVGIYCNVQTGLQFLMGLTDRAFDAPGSQQHTTYMYFCVRTALRNLYHDL